MQSVMNIEPLGERLRSFGARVCEVDGHDPVALAAPAGLTPDGRPLVVLARTNPCFGIDLLAERAPNLHYIRFKSPEERTRYQDYYEALRQQEES
jgi:transketolase